MSNHTHHSIESGRKPVSQHTSQHPGQHFGQRGARQVSIRQRNRARLLQLLRHRELTRGELSAASGLTGAGVSRISRELIEAGLVLERRRSDQQAGAGRRGFTLAINPHGVYVIGVTITANRLSVAISDHSGMLIDQTDVPLTDTRNAEQVLNKLVQATNDLIAICHKSRHCGFDRDRVAGIGVSMAVSSADSICRIGEDKIVVSSQVLCWKNIDVATPFVDRFKLPVEVEPRAVAILRSEAKRSPVEPFVNRDFGDRMNSTFSRSVFLVNVSLGIGAATRVDTEIYGCTSRKVGDLTHVAHPDSEFECDCGRRGCLQHTATGSAVVREIESRRSGFLKRCNQEQNDNSHSNPPVDSQALRHLNPALSRALQFAADGDVVAKQALFNAGARLAYGLDLVQAVLDPDEIVLAGEIGRQPDYIAGVRDGLEQHCTPLNSQQLRVSQSTSSVAAVSIALEAFVFSDRLNLEQLMVCNKTANSVDNRSVQQEVVA